VAPAAPAGLGAYREARTHIAGAVARFAAMRRNGSDISQLESVLATIRTGDQASGTAVRAAFGAIARSAVATSPSSVSLIRARSITS